MAGEKTNTLNYPQWILNALDVLRPPERLTVTEWADKYRILSELDSASPGRWQTSRTPYLKDIMNVFNSNGIQDIVAAAMKAKTENIGGHFSAIALVDIPTDTVKKYTDASAWKDDNNISGSNVVACYPLVKLGDEVFHLSTQLASLMNQVDAAHGDIPYYSPSNKALQASGACLADGTEIFLNSEQGAYLNGRGIVTALNYIGGWRSWGNRTACYPATTDVKDSFIAIRRMFNWIGNTLITSFWQKIDEPANKRLIETIVDSANIWLNGLTARGALLGGRVEFRQDENPTTDLMDGILHFHVFITPPSPARDIEFVQEYDTGYADTLYN